MITERELQPFFADDAPVIERQTSGPVSPTDAKLNGKRSRRAKKKSDAIPPPPSSAEVARAASQPSAGADVGASSSKAPQQKMQKGGKASKPAPAVQPKSAAPKAKPPKKSGTRADSPTPAPEATHATPSKPVFAGAAFEQSPDPSSLPKPRFTGGSPVTATVPVAPPLVPVSLPPPNEAARAQLCSLLGVQTSASASFTSVAAVPQGPARDTSPYAAASMSAAGGAPITATQQLCSMLGVRAC
mmetsp:Transcript_24090/g.62063  ORF Transcript_24090/g.62063 Transcript_24090/m.62063 type:complete len:244 (+) Transcript_24090:88-819(+)